MSHFIAPSTAHFYRPLSCHVSACMPIVRVARSYLVSPSLEQSISRSRPSHPSSLRLSNRSLSLLNPDRHPYTPTGVSFQIGFERAGRTDSNATADDLAHANDDGDGHGHGHTWAQEALQNAPEGPMEDGARDGRDEETHGRERSGKCGVCRCDGWCTG